MRILVCSGSWGLFFTSNVHRLSPNSYCSVLDASLPDLYFCDTHRSSSTKRS